jgi:predicted membrane channel-forming protein YqfA (hemolysin III family)
MRNRQALFLLVAAVALVAAAPGLAMASDWGRPGDWVAGLYLFVAVPFTVASVLGMIAGGSFGWYRDKDAAVAHASIATLLYGCGIPVALFATKSWLGLVVWLVLLGLLILFSIKVPLMWHENQKRPVREKRLKDYQPHDS